MPENFQALRRMVNSDFFVFVKKHHIRRPADPYPYGHCKSLVRYQYGQPLISRINLPSKKSSGRSIQHKQVRIADNIFKSVG